MNHIFDTEDEKVADPELRRREEDSYKPKVQDALKAIQLQQKVAKTSEAEKFFWQEIEAIRNDELPKLYPESNNLEDQLLSAIIGLKEHVKNGIFPVKIIADTFNQARSDQSQLGYRRIGQLLSTMGFRKAKTHGSTYAILWDDNLLAQNTFSDDEKNEK